MDDKRLIDAELLTTNLAQIARACARSDAQKALVGRILFMIDNMPTVEAEPVKHGRWIDNGMVYTCSECNSSVPKNIFVIGCDFEGCPYCFARMDGDSDE